ncbi:MAG: tetratricopeptide repeat protein [Chloroflexi bacterium]|nr:tetratricopeptide repeat protein [Chloroflexota bacterium]
MQTFAELLTEYTSRTGIGDAELARRIPVSRLTLVRWKEGVTERPRYREDVLRVAEILRLTDEERDLLLVAGGFAPEAPPEPAEASLPMRAGEVLPEQAQGTLLTIRPRRRGRAGPAVAATALVVVVVVGLVAGLLLRDTTVYPEAAAGESMIVLAPFVNYTSGQQGFNIVGRLREAIDTEIQEAGLSGARTVEWPKEIEDEEDAEEAGERSGARLVIWGEYDSGRVIARFTVPESEAKPRADEVVDIASSPVGLPVTINAGLTAEVRHVALITLGQLYLEQQEFDLAKTVLIQASTSPPSDPEALANLRFLMGRAYRGGELFDYDEAIWLFTQTLAIRPTSAEAYINRGLSYLDRGREGDTDEAIADLTRALAIDFQNAAAYRGRAAAFEARNDPGDTERAAADLEQAQQYES